MAQRNYVNMDTKNNNTFANGLEQNLILIILKVNKRRKSLNFEVLQDPPPPKGPNNTKNSFMSCAGPQL